MTSLHWVRRALAHAVALIVLSGSFPVSAQGLFPGEARGAGGARFGRIVVDTSPLIGSESPGTAEGVEQAVAANLRQVFADRLVPGDRSAPTLLVRISSISLSSFAGNRSRGHDGASDTDYLEGVGIVSSGGRVLSQTPVLSALRAGYSGAWYLPDIDRRRVDSIAYHFAYWLRREMGD